MSNLDTYRPDVPPEIDTHENNAEHRRTLADLWNEISVELLDQSHSARAHNVATYDAGCRGPICRKALREHPRRRAPHGMLTQMRDERAYDPIIEYFYTVMKYRIRTYQQELLKELA